MSDIKWAKSKAIFKNVDKSILKLNPFLKKFDYEFIIVTIAQLKADYIKLFFRGNTDIIDESGFFEIYENHLLGGELPFSDGNTIMLVNNKLIKYEYKDNHYVPDESWKLSGATQQFKNELIRKLRLFKKGDIYSPGQFVFLIEEKDIMTINASFIQKVTNWEKYTVEDKEITELENHLDKELTSINLTKIAETYFANSYEVRDYNIKFINLITALESLFNSSNNQISHVLSRHLSVLISKDKKSFDENYKRIKKLYGIRSKLIHGQTLDIKENINILVDEVYELTRKSLIICMELKLTKSELFSKLNSDGFSN